MSKEACSDALISAAEVVDEMLEMLDNGEGIQAFIEAYSSVLERLTRAMEYAVMSAVPPPMEIED